MGRLTKGILGGFAGKVGTVVGSSWRGIDVIRSLPKKSKRTPSAEQAIQRLKFGLIINFLSPITILLRDYYGSNPNQRTRINNAVSYHIQEAITGINPDFTIDYPRVIFSKGELQPLMNLAATPQAGGDLEFVWTDNSGEGEALTTDMIVIVAYNDSKKAFETRQLTASRSAMAYTMSFPNSWVGNTVECWTSVVSANKKLWGSTIYMGAIVLV